MLGAQDSEYVKNKCGIDFLDDDVFAEDLSAIRKKSNTFQIRDRDRKQSQALLEEEDETSLSKIKEEPSEEREQKSEMDI